MSKFIFMKILFPDIRKTFPSNPKLGVPDLENKHTFSPKTQSSE